jgi:hypothetical protein
MQPLKYPQFCITAKFTTMPHVTIMQTLFSKFQRLENFRDKFEELMNKALANFWDSTPILGARFYGLAIARQIAKACQANFFSINDNEK